MADKLSESTWTGFTKKQKLELDDKALVKALAAYDKTDESKPEPRLKALEEVIKQIPEQVKVLTKRKKELGDKPFGEAKDKLYALLEEAEALQKKTQAAAAAEEDNDEEPDTPVLLTTKMVPLLRELRKGEVQMHALICTAGKNTAVLIMRRAIAPSRRKLLAEAVDAKGGMKYIVGECQFENKALTFVVKSPAAQLAKRLRQALLDQTEMRLKVKVRGEDGVEELDGEDEDEAQPGAQPQRPAAPQGGPASAEQLAYTQRLRKVRERYEQALREQHPEATKLRALMGFASEKADEQKDYTAAINALETIEKLVDGSAGSQQWLAVSGRVAPAVDAALKAGPGDLGELRAAWAFAQGKAKAGDFAAAIKALGTVARLVQAAQAAKPGKATGDLVAKRTFLLTRWKKIPVDLRVELGTLLKAIRQDYPGEDVVRLGKAIDAKLGQLIDESQARLAAAVDADIGTGDRAYGQTAAQIRALHGEVASNPMIVALRENAFTAGSAFATAFAAALDEIEAALTV